MARFQIKYIDDKPFIALPLKLSFSGASSIRVQKIYIENIFTETPSASDFVFGLNESASDYSQASNVVYADYDINYSTINNPIIDENFGSINFKVLNEFTLFGNNVFNFELLFDPFRVNFFNLENREPALKKTYRSKLSIYYLEDAIAKAPITFNFLGVFTEQEILTIDGVIYEDVLSLQTVNRNNINIIG